MMKRSAGSMHIKSSPDWDIGKGVAFAESIGYKGLYTIEVNPDPAIRIVYNTILVEYRVVLAAGRGGGVLPSLP